MIIGVRISCRMMVMVFIIYSTISSVVVVDTIIILCCYILSYFNLLYDGFILNDAVIVFMYLLVYVFICSI